ncbi:MAG: tRNA glutamyl-Q(34) synthetase GluQRS [Oscillospiraceae bacterium]|nr:tRNA glutamyl-Q(34) synthetase GluQRS [Oscillospiraceae bacterium]
MDQDVIARLAPSPSGYLHMGNLLSLLLAWLDCRAQNGELIFRMEDLDPARSRADYAEAMADDLRWLGLDWDRGWPEPSYAQSRRTAVYEEAFAALEARGLVYPCWCSRAERLAAASAPQPGEKEHDASCRCARFTADEREAQLRASPRPPAWKLRCPDETLRLIDGHYGELLQNPAREVGDFIIRRADGVFAYQLAVSVDDWRMGVTRVVRGRDLLSSSPRQAWLIETLGGRAPSYCHAPLLIESGGSAAGEKLSKRRGSLSMQELRNSFRPEALCGRLAFLCGLIDRDEPVTPRELLADFSWTRVKTEDILCDERSAHP